MNGATALIQTLSNIGIDICFANPGTSEMHIVEALDKSELIRSVLCLHEGVCTGSADGYGRMLGRPATTLLHLGVGISNGLSNLHNARRAFTPVLNIVGDHSVQHAHLDSPLTSDVVATAKPFSKWVKKVDDSGALAHQAVAAVTAACTRSPGSEGNVSTLIVPSNVAWGEADCALSPVIQPQVMQVDEQRIKIIAEVVDANTVFLLGGDALQAQGLRQVSAICNATGARFYCTTFPARIDFGTNLPQVSRLPYLPEQAKAFMDGVQKLILVGVDEPVTFFDYAYRGTPPKLVAQGTQVLRFSCQYEDSVTALSALADYMGASEISEFSRPHPPRPSGKLSPRIINEAVAALLPENSIVSVETGGSTSYEVLQGIVPGSWLSLTGGSLGQSAPVSVGAALACPDRPVITLLGDGCCMYTNQCFWTQARENLNITTLIYNNSSYNILEVEYKRLGINHVGAKAKSMFNITNPSINWVSLANSMGVPGVRVETAEDLCAVLETSLKVSGPRLIDCCF